MRPNICFLLIFFAVLPVWPWGQAALPSLMYSGHARYSALGEAGGAICYDQGAVHYNPAGLAFYAPYAKMPIGFEMFNENLLPDIEWIDYYHRNFSLYGRYRNYFACAITNKHVSFGEYLLTDEMGRSIGAFKWYDNTLILTLAGNLEETDSLPNYAIGINIKWIYSKFPDFTVGNEQYSPSANCFAFDIGYLYREPFLKIFSLGITLQNMGPDVVYFDQNQADPLPFNLKLAFGAAYTIPGLLTATAVLDFNKELVRRRDGTDDILEYGEPRPPDPFWKAFVTAWLDDPFEEEMAGIVRSCGLDLLFFDKFAARWGMMVDKEGMRWESTWGFGIETYFFDFSVSRIGELEHTHYKYDWPESTARNKQTQFTMGIRLPLEYLLKEHP